MKYIEKLHYITHDLDHLSHVAQAQLACEAGAKWIQYRCLTKSDEALLQDIHAIAEICDDWGTTLIVTNHVHLLGRADIQGFHMENMETDFEHLRKQLGDDVTLGASANTIDQLVRLTEGGADYIGYGPFSTSTTKPNQFPHLSLDTYANTMHELSNMNIDIPILAVGGVLLDDVQALMATGIYGVAISAGVYNADDFIDAYRDFYDAVKG